MRIGLTGQIGAGKSMAAEILRSFGACIVNADEIGRRAVEKSARVRKQLTAAFGPSVLDSSNQIRRQRLARLAFASPEQTEKLNAIVHPVLLKRLRSEIVKAERSHKVVVVDAALLLTWGLEGEMDLVVVITAPEKIRFKRMAERGITAADARARQKAQPSADRMRQASNVIIENAGSQVQLAGKLVQFWNRHVLAQLHSPSQPGSTRR